MRISDTPLISCLCVTRHKVPLLRRAIRCFQDQTYPNKELVIVYEDDDLPTAEFLGHIDDSKIVQIEVPGSPKRPLGELRNLSVEKCNGEYFCQWDDDDWSHNSRLEFQMSVIGKSRMPACALIHWLVFDATENQAYLSHRRPWEGSLLCKKSLLGKDIQYKVCAKGEDTSVIQELFSMHLIFPVIMPKLYIYVYHGQNTWGYEHWRPILEAGRRLSAASSRLIGEILSGRYSGKKASELLDQISE